MSDYFHCDICDETLKIKSKKNHLSSQSQYYFDKNIVARYRVNKPEFLQIENILKSHIRNYNKRFALYSVICKWKLNFSITIIDVKSKHWWSVSYRFNLTKFLLLKIKY